MPPALIRATAATLQIGLGLLAVLAAAATATLVVDGDVNASQGLSVGVVLVLGLALSAVWGAARQRPRWLRLLGVLTAVLAIATTAVMVHRIRLVRGTPNGLWTDVWVPAVGAALWLVITLATVVELRQLPRLGDARPRGWPYAAAVAAPLVLVVALPVLAGWKASAAMVRFNSAVTAAEPARPGPGSALSGRLRWETTLAASEDVVVTRSGLAVPVAGDTEDSAGVLMLDPATGATVWRYQLHGLESPPQLAPTDDGRSVVLSFDQRDLDDRIPDETFTLDAATGRVQAFWPHSGEVRDTDPPVLFDHVPQGANSVIAISPTGRHLWTYRPESCADPRGVQSTPTVMVVHARQCGPGNGAQILGLDARTGERRWTQPAETDTGETGPDAVTLDAGHRLELGAGGLRNRRLDTGALTWTTVPGGPCASRSGSPAGRSLVASTQTAFLACEDQTRGGPSALTAFSTASGAQRWQREVPSRIRSLAAVDDDRVLALAQGAKTCDVQLVTAARTTTLWSVPDDDASRSTANADCEDSRVVRAGDTFLVVLQLRSNDQPGRLRYRVVALS